MPTDLADVAHLLRRTGFGASLSEAASLTALSRTELVDRALDFAQNPPVDFDPAASGTDSYDVYVRARRWWADRMASAPRPLHEKLTLFWHGHFATSMRKVGDGRLMWQQNQIFRTKGAGDLDVLVNAVAVDPAILRWLDNAYNRKNAINENWGRELMELFLLGVDNGYVQSDIVSMARAWTGHNLDESGDVPVYVFNPNQHDATSKTLFGVPANWDGPDVIRAMVAGTLADTRGRVARHIAVKLWSFFAYPDPDAGLAARLTNLLMATPKLNIAAFLRQMFLQDEFWSATAKHGLLRTPTEWGVNLVRASGLPFARSGLEWQLSEMGHSLFDPPHVAGWKQNRYWITEAQLWKKASAAEQLFNVAVADPANGGVSFANTIPTLAADAAIALALELLGEDRIAAGSTTWNALKTLLEGARANHSWTERRDLFRGIALTPEFTLA